MIYTDQSRKRLGLAYSLLECRHVLGVTALARAPTFLGGIGTHLFIHRILRGGRRQNPSIIVERHAAAYHLGWMGRLCRRVLPSASADYAGTGRGQQY